MKTALGLWISWLMLPMLAAQPTNLYEKNLQMLQPLPLHRRVLLATDERLQIWADRYEILFVNINFNPLDTAKLAGIVSDLAATRLFVTDNYPDRQQLSGWAMGQNLLIFNLVLPPSADSVFVLNDPNLNLQLCEGLRATEPNTLQVWYFMAGGLLAGAGLYGIMRAYLKNKKKQSV